MNSLEGVRRGHGTTSEAAASNRCRSYWHWVKTDNKKNIWFVHTRSLALVWVSVSIHPRRCTERKKTSKASGLSFTYAKQCIEMEWKIGMQRLPSRYLHRRGPRLSRSSSPRACSCLMHFLFFFLFSLLSLPSPPPHALPAVHYALISPLSTSWMGLSCPGLEQSACECHWWPRWIPGRWSITMVTGRQGPTSNATIDRCANCN